MAQATGLRTGGGKFRYSFPYFSTVRFATTISGAGPYVYTLNSTPVRAFNYAIGDNPVAAGYSATWTATAAETNLITRNETASGESVLIKGIGAIIRPWSDARLAALVFANTAVEFSLNADANKIKMGTLDMIPGGAGLYGAGLDLTGTQAIPGGRPQYGFFSNGLPVAGNVFRVPEGVVWRNKGSRDSMLNLICTPASSTVSRTLTLGAPADEAAAAGIRGYAHPVPSDVLGPFVDVTFYLVGMVLGQRSQFQ